jgi:hypothetical protein
VEIQEVDIQTFCRTIERGTPFVQVGYSDAEWFSIIGHCLGERTGLGQVLDHKVGARLRTILREKAADPRWIFAVPSCMWEREDFIAESIGARVEKELEGLGATLVERDTITDDLAEGAGLAPLIEAARYREVVLVGNKYLTGLAEQGIIQPREFVEATCPNQHLDLRAFYHRLLSKRYPRKALFLLSVGMSSAFVPYWLEESYPQASFFDCGSIWDVFVGIGCQREWRRRLYADPRALAEWRRRCLNG